MVKRLSRPCSASCTKKWGCTGAREDRSAARAIGCAMRCLSTTSGAMREVTTGAEADLVPAAICWGVTP